MEIAVHLGMILQRGCMHVIAGGHNTTGAIFDINH